MKKSTLLATTLALPLMLAACEKEACLTAGYNATLNLVRDVNSDRCQAWLDGDRRSFDCPTERLEGEVGGGLFQLRLESADVAYTFDKNALRVQCGREKVVIDTPSVVDEIRGRWMSVLMELEVD